MVSSKIEDQQLSINDVGQSRSLKSYSLNEVKTIFDKDFYIDLGSDWTMPALRHYQNEISSGKCLLINDATLLFASKSQRSKDRITNGLSELIADQKYIYQNFCQENKFVLKGKVTAIMNITTEAYEDYKNRLFKLTFAERFLTLYHELTRSEKEDWTSKQEVSQKLRYPEKITVDDIETNVQIPKKYFAAITAISREYSYLSMKTFVGCQDTVKGVIRAHASLNKRKEVCTDDFMFVLMLKKYLMNPHNPEGLIVKLRAQGLSISDICLRIGKTPNYRQQVQRVLEKARLRGILDA